MLNGNLGGLENTTTIVLVGMLSLPSTGMVRRKGRIWEAYCCKMSSTSLPTAGICWAELQMCFSMYLQLQKIKCVCVCVVGVGGGGGGGGEEREKCPTRCCALKINPATRSS